MLSFPQIPLPIHTARKLPLPHHNGRLKAFPLRTKRNALWRREIWGSLNWRTSSLTKSRESHMESRKVWMFTHWMLKPLALFYILTPRIMAARPVPSKSLEEPSLSILMLKRETSKCWNRDLLAIVHSGPLYSKINNWRDKIYALRASSQLFMPYP